MKTLRTFYPCAHDVQRREVSGAALCKSCFEREMIFRKAHQPELPMLEWFAQPIHGQKTHAEKLAKLGRILARAQGQLAEIVKQTRSKNMTSTP